MRPCGESDYREIEREKGWKMIQSMKVTINLLNEEGGVRPCMDKN